MKIGIDARFLTHPQRGGFKTYTLSVAFSLAEANLRDEFILYTDRETDEIFDLPTNFLIKPVVGSNAIFREQVLLPRQMFRDNIDLAHFPCNTAPISINFPMVVTILDVIPFRKDFKPTERKQKALTCYWRTIVPIAARKAAKIITVSEYVRHDLKELLKIPLEKTCVAPISLEASANKARRPKDFDSDSPFILAFASADGRKNHSGVIKAFETITREMPNLRLALVCSHKDVMQSIPNSKGVISLHPVASEELQWLYRNALALVFPSFDEGFGLPPVEAMALGTPVAASWAGSLPEVAGDAAVLVDPRNFESIANGIRQILWDSALRQNLIEKGLKRVSQLNHKSVGEKLIAAYSSALMGNGN